MKESNRDKDELPHGKQFIDAQQVVGGIAEEPSHDEPQFSAVIEPARVRLSGRPVVPNWGPKPLPDDIKVDIVRENGRIKGLKITCTCGRHTALDVEYAPNGAGT